VKQDIVAKKESDGNAKNGVGKPARLFSEAAALANEQAALDGPAKREQKGQMGPRTPQKL